VRNTPRSISFSSPLPLKQKGYYLLGSLVNNTFDDVVVMEIWLEGEREGGIKGRTTLMDLFSATAGNHFVVVE
jgi:hypothetical protein